MTQFFQLDLFAGDGSITSVFRICPEEAYNSDLRDFIELCGGMVLAPGDMDPCVINIVDVCWVMKNYRAGCTSTARIPDDHFHPNFIYDCYRTKQLQNLNKYRMGGSAYEAYDANELLKRKKSWNDLQLKEVDKADNDSENIWDDLRNNNLKGNSSRIENNCDTEELSSNRIRVEILSDQELLLRNHLSGTTDELSESSDVDNVEEELFLPEETLTRWSACAKNTTEPIKETANKKADKNMLNPFCAPDIETKIFSGGHQNKRRLSKKRRDKASSRKSHILEDSDSENKKNLERMRSTVRHGPRLTRKMLKSLRAAQDVVEIMESDNDEEPVIKPSSTAARFLKRAIPDKSDEQETTAKAPLEDHSISLPRIAVQDAGNGDEDLNETANGEQNLDNTSPEIQSEEDSDDVDFRKSPRRKGNHLISPTRSKTVTLKEDSELVISPIHRSPNIRLNRKQSDSSSGADNAKKKSISSTSSNSSAEITAAAHTRKSTRMRMTVENGDEAESSQSLRKVHNSATTTRFSESRLNSSRVNKKAQVQRAHKPKNGSARNSDRTISQSVRRVKPSLTIMSSDSESQSDSDAKPLESKFSGNTRPKRNLSMMDTFSEEEGKPLGECPYCAFKAKGMKNIVQHINKDHRKLSDAYKCEDCEFSTTTAYNLRVHRTQTHD